MTEVILPEVLRVKFVVPSTFPPLLSVAEIVQASGKPITLAAEATTHPRQKFLFIKGLDSRAANGLD